MLPGDEGGGREEDGGVGEEEDWVAEGGHQGWVDLEESCSAKHPDTLGDVDPNGFILRTEQLPWHGIAH